MSDALSITVETLGSVDGSGHEIIPIQTFGPNDLIGGSLLDITSPESGTYYQIITVYGERSTV
jgi:hypothetical protein